jgi:flagellar biosynthesis chaperone FliJ
MRRFRFRLETVLRVARIREQRDRQQLALENRRAQEAAGVEAARRAAYDARPEPVPADAPGFEAASITAALRARAVREAEDAREAAIIRAAAAREEWLRASRNVKSLEQLEERHRAAHAMVAARAAQRALDDLARLRRGGAEP